MKKIKLVHIITGLHQGGAEAVLYRVLSQLDQNKYDITVVSLKSQGIYSGKIESLGVRVVHLHMNKWNVPITIFKLYCLIKQLKPDILQTWMYHANFFGSMIGKLLKCPFIVWNVRNTGKKLKFMTRMINKSCAQLSRYIPTCIVYCALDAQRYQESLGYDVNKSHYIPNGYDIILFKPQEKRSIRKQLNLPTDKVLFGGLGRNHVDKDFINFIDAAEKIIQQHVDARFVLCGKGLQSLYSSIRVKKLEQYFFLLPATEQPQQYLACLDFFVLSSDTEAFPNVVAEAMACDIPCVVTDVGDAAYIVGDTGLVVPPRNSEALAQACLKMIALSSAEHMALGQKARVRIIEHFSLEKMVGQYEALYQRVLEQK